MKSNDSYTSTTVKAWIQQHWLHTQHAEDPIVALYEASAAVTGEKAKAWFQWTGGRWSNDDVFRLRLRLYLLVTVCSI